ncbi:MAG: hemerythrin domain-containing protein [Sciscionella sp.]
MTGQQDSGQQDSGQENEADLPPDARKEQASHPGAEGTGRPITRRSLVVAGVGLAGLAVGAGGTKAAERIAGTPPIPQSAALPATEDLMTDHGLLKRILLIYRECSRRLDGSDQLAPAPLFHSAQIVHDYIEGFHEGMEEGYVFPALQRAGKLTDTVRTLLVQHDRGRKLTVSIIRGSTTMTMGGMSSPGFATAGSRKRLAGMLDAFVRMYEPHEAREDTEVFPTFREVVPHREFDRISEQVAGAEREHYGEDGFRLFVEQVSEIESQLGIHDLDLFTPALIDPVSGQPSTK